MALGHIMKLYAMGIGGKAFMRTMSNVIHPFFLMICLLREQTGTAVVQLSRVG
jgi:hypothetical protein